MKNYSYSILRYIHDITTCEFINVGVAIYCPETQYASAQCRSTFGRLGKVFPDMNKEFFKAQMRFIQSRFEELGERLAAELPFGENLSIETLAHQILPADDSSLQWAQVGYGKTDNPSETLDYLFERFVTRYEESIAYQGRTKDDVWRSFKKTLESRQVLQHFSSQTVISEGDEIQFEYAWRNGKLHCLEPVSFDLMNPESIRDKAHQWLGRIASISSQSTDKLSMYFLVGRPQKVELEKAFEIAVGILKKVPVECSVYSEQQSEELGDRIKQEVDSHLATLNR